MARKRSDKRREEIEELKKRIKELEDSHAEEKEDLGEDESEEEFEKPRKKGRSVKGYVIALVILIIILLVIDLLVLFVYFVPFNLNSNGNSVKTIDKEQCSDGTLNEHCSKEKPNYCLNGELVENPYICGCPEGYERDFQSCRKI